MDYENLFVDLAIHLGRYDTGKKNSAPRIVWTDSYTKCTIPVGNLIEIGFSIYHVNMFFGCFSSI